MIRYKQSCYSIADKDKYPFDEVLLFWSIGGTIDVDAVLLRQLEAVSSLEALTNRKEIYLHSIEFAGYDTADTIIKTDAEQDKEYANELILGNMLTTSWQPNYCRPIVRINGMNITSSISTFGNADYSKSIGLPLPFCLTINKIIKEPKDIEIYGSLAQRTPVGYRNYPLLAIINFWHSFN
jgi:hypothetical protein